MLIVKGLNEGTRTDSSMKNFFQKTLFLKWAEKNRNLFRHMPYLSDQGNNYFAVGFQGITPYITCYFFEAGGIEVRIPFLQTIFDILMDFDLYEEKTPEGRWICTLCRVLPDPENPEPLIHYASREELWIKHSFEPLADWTQKTFSPEAWLCLCHSKGTAWASIMRGAEVKKN